MSSVERNGVNSNEIPFTPRALSSIVWIHTHTRAHAKEQLLRLNTTLLHKKDHNCGKLYIYLTYNHKRSAISV